MEQPCLTWELTRRLPVMCITSRNFDCWPRTQAQDTEDPRGRASVDQINGHMVLVDGRNRREACRRAGVIPDYVLLDGADPVAYILSANINRRQLTRGQRVMTAAKVFATKTSHGDNKKISGLVGVSQADLSAARTILKHAPDLANNVIMGHISLDNAYEEARIRKGRAETHESRFNARKAPGKFNQLAEPAAQIVTQFIAIPHTPC